MRDGPVRVVVVDDHPMFRAGLRTLVDESDRLELVGEADNGADALTVCRGERPDVVLMDVRMPGTSGVDVTRELTGSDPAIGVLMLTMLEDDTTVFAAMRAGARGYILKGSAPDEIVRAVEAVAAGEAIFGAALAGRMSHFFTAGRGGEPHPFPELTTRERDVLDRIAAGEANSVIAARLGLSEKTVRNNVSAILAKLLVADRAQAIVKARDAGIGTLWH